MRTCRDVKVNVKPVFANLVHSEAYEGPCRVGKHENLTPEADRKKGRKGFEIFAGEIEEKAGSHVNILEPTYIERMDDFVVHESELRKLEPDIWDADLVLVSGSGLRQVPSIMIGARYGKPIGQMGWVSSVDVTANLRSRGLEGYAFLDYEHLNSFLKLMQVRKAFRETRIMIVTQDNSFPTGGVVSSITDMAGLRKRFGTDHTFLSATRLVEAMDDLSAGEKQEADELTDSLIGKAQACHMKREDVLPSVEFYVVAKRFLEQYECNAFTIPCFEICATKKMEARRVMFCLAHTLLKDRAVPSSCEADTNVLMAMALLTYVSGKSVFMGNPREKDRKNNILRVSHDVPGLQMKGFDQPPLPYELRNFTEGGWGATVRYDFSQDEGQPVTMARFNPAGDRVLTAAGTITGADGFDRIGCSLGADMELRDIEDFFDKQQDFGHHLAVVYGDYTEQIKHLSRIMDFEVVTS